MWGLRNWWLSQSFYVVNQELAKLGFVDAGQVMTVDPNGNARLDLKKISDDPDPETGERRPLPRYSAAIQEITEKTWTEGKGENARPVREIKLKLTRPNMPPWRV